MCADFRGKKDLKNLKLKNNITRNSDKTQKALGE